MATLSWQDIFRATPADDGARAEALISLMQPKVMSAGDTPIAVKAGGQASPFCASSPVAEALQAADGGTVNYGGCLGWFKLNVWGGGGDQSFIETNPLGWVGSLICPV